MSNLPEDQVAKIVPPGERAELQRTARETEESLDDIAVNLAHHTEQLKGINASAATSAQANMSLATAVLRVATDTRLLVIIIGMLVTTLAALVFLIGVGVV